MKLHQQIKHYRTTLNLSQEELADKIFVTRQSVSNWETEKNYPDIHSLLLMSSLFNVSLDQIVKGDLEIMKETIDAENCRKNNLYVTSYTIMFIVFILSIAPLIYYFEWYGILVVAIFFVLLMFVALKVEKIKKDNDVQTYKEIVAFMSGERLDEISKLKESGKRPYQKFILAITFAIIAFIVTILLLMLFEFIA